MSDLNLDDFGEPRIKVVALPKDTNSSGNIFGGWILAQIDLAGATAAREIAPERVVTISMQEVIFKQPVFIGDVISCYAKSPKCGKYLYPRADRGRGAAAGRGWISRVLACNQRDRNLRKCDQIRPKKADQRRD